MRQYLLAALLALFTTTLFAQPDPVRFENEIRQFEKQDSALGIRKNVVLFTGSSSIRLWKTLENDMAPIPVLNRGFGGSTLPELLYFTDRIILPYHPEIVVVYCGENDIANDSTTADDVLESFKALSKYFRKKLPKTQLYYISMKPSVSRWKYWTKVNEGNRKIEAYIKKKKNFHYIDTASGMLDSNGLVFQDIFIDDNLHMNDKGYAIWTAIIKPLLKDALKE